MSYILDSAEVAEARLATHNKALKEKLNKIDCDINQSDVIVMFKFDLANLAAHKTVDGLVVFTNESIFVFRDGVLEKQTKLSGIAEFKCVAGVGELHVEAKDTEQNDLMICRANSSKLSEIAAIIKRINVYLATGEFTVDYAEKLTHVCEKCGRPFPKGSSMCMQCVDKKNILKRLWEVAKPYKWYLFTSVFLYFVITGLNMLLPYINQRMIDDYIMAVDGSTRIPTFALVVATIFGVNLLTALFTILRGKSLIIAGNKVIIKLREMVFEKIQLLSISRIAQRTVGNIMNRVTRDTRRIQFFVTHHLSDAFQQAMIFLAVSVILFIYDWKLALLILVPCPFVMWSFEFFGQKCNRLWKKMWNRESKVDTVLHDIFSGIRVIKAFGMEDREAERFDKATRDSRDVNRHYLLIWSRTMPILNFFVGIGEFFLLYYVGNKVLGGEMSLGKMTMFSSYVAMMYGPLRWFARFPRHMIEVLTSVAKVFEIIDERVDVADSDNPIQMEIKGSIEFNKVAFGYVDDSEVLSDINLHVNPGEMIGIVGKSGVGKSTLINLVMRMYDVESGEILIDGVNIKDIGQESLRSQIGVVLQETFLFAGSIYDNIAYAKPDATREEVIAAAKVSGAHQFIMKLPDAYNTRVGEKGHTLSGGERQRVSIARALLHNPKILILDEATAALDTETEHQIQDALKYLSKNRTTLAIAHRLSTLRNADRLVVLDKGKVAEIGTHEELLQKKGIYYGLVNAQRQMSKMTNGTKNANK